MLSHLKVFFSRSEYLATAAGFFLLGFLFGNWATLIPYIKATFSLNDATLGLVLLCMPIGTMSFNPVAARLIQKFGLKTMTIFGMIFLSVAYLIPFLITSLYILPVTLVTVGIGMTMLNISINILAISLERKYEQFIMSTCHGMFSVGLMIGSLMRSITLLLEIHEVMHMMFMVLISLMLAMWAIKVISRINLEQSVQEEKQSETRKSLKFTLPSGVLLSVIIISICVNFTEGSMTDWASVYMHDVVNTNQYFIGWGLFGYSFLMALGRFFGDGLIPVYGRKKILMYGAFLSFLGVLVIIMFPFTVSAIAGFGMIGLGVSCGSPILYSSATRISGLSGENGLATMNFYAMAGFLVGPVIIGFISEISSLPVAFGVIMLLAMVWFYKGMNIDLP
jgi:MFS family permease